MEDLSSIKMEKGMLYETIISTQNSEGIPNAAPIGVTCKNSSEIVLYLFEGTHTLQNIKLNQRFTVNILKDPLIFTQCTVGEIQLNHYGKHKNDFFIKKADAYFTATVKSFKEVEKDDSIGKSKMNIIIADVEEIIIKNECVEPLNRAIYAVIESLVYLSRIDLVDEETASQYSQKIKEMSLTVSRVGGVEHKKAMKSILKRIGN